MEALSLTSAQMLERERRLYDEDVARFSLEQWPAIPRYNQHIMWALAVACGRMPMRSIENARYMYAGIPF